MSEMRGLLRTCGRPGCGENFTVKFPSTRKRFCGYSCSNSMTAQNRTRERNSNWRGGKTEHQLYEIYLDMVARCGQPNHPRYADYGGRGITVCERWRDDFWAYVGDVGQRPSAPTLADGRASYSLDRIDNDGNYEPGNCRWATSSQQSQNRRTTGWERRTRNEKGQFA